MDGYMSGSELCSFLKELGYNKLSYIIHDQNPKAHGLEDAEVISKLKDMTPSLLIIPDAGSMNIEECGQLKELGWECVILDHHIVPIEGNPNATLVNCQSSEKVENKSASGALVTWHLMHLMNPRIANKYISYASISIISDSMSFLTNENITFIYHGLKRLHPNLERIVDKIQKDYLPISFAFGGLNPKGNATIRLGTYEDKIRFFEALCGKDIDIDEVVSKLKYYHNKQNEEVKKLLEDHISIDNEASNVLLCKIDCKTPLTGLVANKLMSKSNKPVLMVHEREEGTTEGSARSPIDLKSVFNDSGKFLYAEGHECSFGLGYSTDNENDIKEYLYSLRLSEPQYKVLEEKAVNSLSYDLIDAYEPYRALYGNDLKEPQYYIETVINKDQISAIGNGTTIKFKIGNWTFIKFFCSKEWIKGNIEDRSKQVKIEMIGSPKWNIWNGRKYPQFVIDKIEISDFGIDSLF